MKTIHKFVLIIISLITFSAISSVANAADRSFYLINKSGYKICEFYASNIYTNDWQNDVLGRTTLRTNRQVAIDLDDYTGSCEFDFKIVACDGSAIIRNDINVCQISTYTVNDNF